MVRETNAVVSDLVQIGVVMGETVAWRMYRALGHEPISGHGERIDWTEILAEIRRVSRT